MADEAQGQDIGVKGGEFFCEKLPANGLKFPVHLHLGRFSRGEINIRQVPIGVQDLVENPVQLIIFHTPPLSFGMGIMPR